MEALLDLQPVLASRWLMSVEGRAISKMMNSIHGATIAENNFLA